VEPLRKLPRREREIMDALFARGRATVADVIATMPDPPSYSAVRATLRVLEDKGLVDHRQDGAAYVYFPKVARESASRAALRDLVRTFFNGSPEQAAVALLEMSDTQLSEAEIKRLAERITNAKSEGR
jgi:BlaI family transcriptional regulator, penicillinase repressor